MKLSEILENVGEFVVYKAFSPGTNEVYYGYGQGDLRRTFIAGATRNAADRTEARMLDAIGGEENLKIQELEVFASEYEAFMERNDLRAKDPDSISGPSNFPASMFERAKQENPERVAGWKSMQDLANLSARDAMNPSNPASSQSKYTYADVKALAASPTIKKQLAADLDTMTHSQFAAKYFPDRH